VIAVAVRWYLRCGLSYRDVEELLAERGIEVDHAAVSSLRPAPDLITGAARSRRTRREVDARAATGEEALDSRTRPLGI
jgi:transposase-like protein